MDAFELYQLSRKLKKVAEQAMPDDWFRRLRGSTRAIINDIFANPGSSVSEITERVRLPQGQVSSCVARLREHEIVETVDDPADRRKTLVRPSPEALERSRTRPVADIDEALAGVIADGDADAVKRAKEALAVLDELLR